MSQYRIGPSEAGQGRRTEGNRIAMSDYTDDVNRRANLARTQAGVDAAVMPEDWDYANLLAEGMAELDGIEFEFDSNPIAQRLAADMVRTLTALWSRYHDERPVDTRYCPEYDDANPHTMSRLYVLTHMDRAAHPLRNPSQYRQAASELLKDSGGCYPSVTRKCDKVPSKFVAVKRGEYLCLFKLCRTCRKALETLAVDSDEYNGPDEWYDDRTASAPDATLPLNPWASDPFELPPDNDPRNF